MVCFYELVFMITHDGQTVETKINQESIQIPVQVLRNDSEVFSKFMGNSEFKQAQVTLDEYSGGELDCSGVMAFSDDDYKNKR